MQLKNNGHNNVGYGVAGYCHGNCGKAKLLKSERPFYGQFLSFSFMFLSNVQKMDWNSGVARSRGISFSKSSKFVIAFPF